MPILLDCQKGDTDPRGDRIDKAYLRGFTVAMLSHLLEMFEDDLSPDESMRIDHFISEWIRK